MNPDNIFKGKCFVCHKEKYITTVYSWSGQKAKGSEMWIPSGYRFFCNDCSKSLGWQPNRQPNVCGSCQKKFIGSKYANVCSKCSGGKNGK